MIDAVQTQFGTIRPMTCRFFSTPEIPECFLPVRIERLPLIVEFSINSGKCSPVDVRCFATLVSFESDHFEPARQVSATRSSPTGTKSALTIRDGFVTVIQSPMWQMTKRDSPHEKQWMAAWRRAGPELERIRKEVLRALDDKSGTLQATWPGVSLPTESKSDSGLREFQIWMEKMAKRRKRLEAANERG